MSFYQNWKYENYSQSFEVADGEHKVTIMGAKEATSKAGNGMIEITLKVDGANTTYTERYVDNEYFNRNMSRFFDAFAIQYGNFNFASWSNKTAVGHFEHKEESFTDKNGMLKIVNKAVMKYLIVPEKKDDFPQITQAQGVQPGFNDAGASAAFSSRIQLKGGAATREQSELIKDLLSRTYANGLPVFTEEEKTLYSSYRKEKFTAAELIDFIQNAYTTRTGMPVF